MTTVPSSAQPAGASSAWNAFDHLATMVAVVQHDGACVFANAAFENVLGLSRRNVLRGSLFDWFVESQIVRDTVTAVSRNDFSTSRFDGLLKRPLAAHGEPLPVHVIVNQMDAGELVIVNASVESESLVALNRNTGKEVWTAPFVQPRPKGFETWTFFFDHRE